MTTADYFIGSVRQQNARNALSPDMMKLWHPTLNGGLPPTAVTSGSRKKAWWRCEKGHAWQAKVYTVTAGSSCPYCAGKKPIAGQTDLTTTHPNKALLWSQRNALPPTEVTAGSHKRVWWRCDRGHEWEASIGSVVVDGCGCPYCAGKRAIPGETDLVTLRPDLAAQWDREKNTLDPGNLTVASHDKVWWKCGLGHSWKAAVFSRTRENGSGCPYCAGRMVLSGFNDLATLKPDLAGEWHQELNGELKPRDVTLGSNKKVWWQCSEGHVWQAFVYARAKTNGTGCPVCAGTAKRRGTAVEWSPGQNCAQSRRGRSQAAGRDECIKTTNTKGNE